MKKTLLFLSLLAVLAMSSCSKKGYTETYAPEERVLNLMKITNEANNEVVGMVHGGGIPGKFAATTYGGNKKANIHWLTDRMLDVSPDGQQIAFITRKNKQFNIMISSAFAQSASTQRTFRNVSDFSWGADGKFYFADYIDRGNMAISTVDSQVGNLVRQLTNGNRDNNPVVSSDGRMVFFTRTDPSGPSIWSLNLQTGALTNCAIGYNPCVIAGNNDEFICVRNSSAGNSEIWRVNYVLGQETAILTNKDVSYTNPSVSPDGQWITVQGNAKSNITKKDNLDIFAARTDGTSIIQLTFHPNDDCCPVFSRDGRYIYFLSTRATKEDAFNVWRLTFNPGR